MNIMIDWFETFRPAALCLLNGNCDPYTYIYNVPWVLFPLIPFAVWDPLEGAVLFSFATLAALVLIALRLSRHSIGALAFAISPLTYNSVFLVGNVEWLALLGLVAHPAIGLLLLAIKPQMTSGIIVFILFDLWRADRWRNRRKFWLTTLPLFGAMTFAVLGTPMVSRLSLYSTYTHSPVNTSLGMLGIPIGIALLWLALTRRQMVFALASSPFFFSVITPQTWLVVVLALATCQTIATVLSTAVLWSYIALVRMG